MFFFYFKISQKFIYEPDKIFFRLNSSSETSFGFFEAMNKFIKLSEMFFRCFFCQTYVEKFRRTKTKIRKIKGQACCPTLVGPCVGPYQMGQARCLACQVQQRLTFFFIVFFLNYIFKIIFKFIFKIIHLLSFILFI